MYIYTIQHTIPQAFLKPVTSIQPCHARSLGAQPLQHPRRIGFHVLEERMNDLRATCQVDSSVKLCVCARSCDLVAQSVKIHKGMVFWLNTPLKTNITLENPHFPQETYTFFKWWIFHYHVSFPGGIYRFKNLQWWASNPCWPWRSKQPSNLGWLEKPSINF